MDFDRDIEQAKSVVLSSIGKLESLIGRYEESVDKTNELLNRCMEAGYSKVSVGRRHKSIPDTVSFPFGTSGSIFGFMPKKNESSKHTWPPIWGIVEGMGIDAGCGNNHQKQADTSNLIDGVYHLRNGKWKKVEE